MDRRSNYIRQSSSTDTTERTSSFVWVPNGATSYRYDHRDPGPDVAASSGAELNPERVRDNGAMVSNVRRWKVLDPLELP